MMILLDRNNLTFINYAQIDLYKLRYKVTAWGAQQLMGDEGSSGELLGSIKLLNIRDT